MEPNEIEALQTELRNAEYTLLGVMHSVDKWLDGKELQQDEVNRAVTMREKTLRIVEKLEAELEQAKTANQSLLVKAKATAKANAELAGKLASVTLERDRLWTILRGREAESYGTE